MKKIYRVYEPYHSSEESGTYEYGYFSTRKKAEERLMEIYKQERKEGESDIFEFRPKKGYLCLSSGNGWRWIYIEEVKVDKKIEEKNTGYT